MPGIVLATRDSSMNKVNKILHWENEILVGKMNNKQIYVR